MAASEVSASKSASVISPLANALIRYATGRPRTYDTFASSYCAHRGSRKPYCANPTNLRPRHTVAAIAFNTLSGTAAEISASSATE